MPHEHAQQWTGQRQASGRKAVGLGPSLALGVAQVALDLRADTGVVEVVEERALVDTDDVVDDSAIRRACSRLLTTPVEIRDTVAALLSDDPARPAAQRMQREITALPGPDSALPLLETVARP